MKINEKIGEDPSFRYFMYKLYAIFFNSISTFGSLKSPSLIFIFIFYQVLKQSLTFDLLQYQ